MTHSALYFYTFLKNQSITVNTRGIVDNWRKGHCQSLNLKNLNSSPLIILKRVISVAGKCQKPLEVVFVLDSSEKVGKENWEKIINASINIASQFDYLYTQFAVIQYQTYPEITIKLSKFTDDKQLADTFKKLFYKAGGKRTDLALNKTLDVFKYAKPRKASKVFDNTILPVFIVTLGTLSKDYGGV